MRARRKTWQDRAIAARVGRKNRKTRWLSLHGTARMMRAWRGRARHAKCALLSLTVAPTARREMPRLRYASATCALASSNGLRTETRVRHGHSTAQRETRHACRAPLRSVPQPASKNTLVFVFYAGVTARARCPTLGACTSNSQPQQQHPHSVRVDSFAPPSSITPPASFTPPANRLLASLDLA